MKGSPAFQYYPSDMEMDTADWSCQEVGVYLRLLNYQWKHGVLPSDTSRLARVVRESEQVFNVCWESVQRKFVQNENGEYLNERLEKERQKQVAYREAKQRAGKSSAKKRALKQNSNTESTCVATGVATEGATDSQQNSTLHTSYFSNKTLSIGDFENQPVDNSTKGFLPDKFSAPTWLVDQFRQTGIPEDHIKFVTPIIVAKLQELNDQLTAKEWCAKFKSYLTKGWRLGWDKEPQEKGNGKSQSGGGSRAKRVSDKLDKIAREDIEQNGFAQTLGN